MTEIPTTDGPILIEEAAPGIAVIRTPSMCDVYTGPALRQASVDLIRAGTYRLVVDLAAIQLIDSLGLGVLVGMAKRACALGGQVVLADLSANAANAVRITGLAKFIEQYPTVEDALESLGAPRKRSI